MRFTIPRARRSLVARTRLYDALGDRLAFRLICASAPAGFGKSSLIADWLRTLPTSPHAAWWNLSSADDSPHTFVQHLAEALSANGANNSNSSNIAHIATAVSHGDMAPEKGLSLVIDALAQDEQPRLLILDDLHLLHNEPVHALLRSLVDDAPPHLHLIFLSRTPPPFSLMRLRLAGDLLELTARDLAFDREEFQAFVRSGPLAHSAPERIAEIERRTEGWPAGLQLFALAAAQKHSNDSAVADAFLAEYLHGELLRRLPTPLAAALLQSAFLLTLDAAGLSFVLCIDRAAALSLLQDIQQTDLPFQKFEQHASAHSDLILRLHPLFRDYLLAQLPTQIPAADVADLRTRSATALAAAGDVDAALTLLTDDSLGAARVIAAHSRAAILRTDIVSLRRWLRMLPAEALRSQPQLVIDDAWLAYGTTDKHLRERYSTARAVIDAIGANFPDHVRSEWEAELHVLDAIAAQDEWNFDRVRAALQRAADTPHDPRGLAEAFRLQKSIYVPPHSPALAEQGRLLQQAAAIFHELKHEHANVECLMAHGVLLWRSFDLPRALIAFNEAAAIVAAENLELSATAAELHYARGELFFLMNRLDEARAEFERVLQLHTLLGDSVSMVDWARVHLQECALLAGASSQDVLDNDAAHWAAVRHKSPHWVVTRSAWMRVRRDLRTGQLLGARRIAAGLGASLDQLTPEMPESQWLALLLSELYAGEATESLLGSLRQLREIARQREWAWLDVYLQILEVVLLMRTRRTEAAHTMLRDILPRIEEARAARMILDFPDLGPLLAVEGSHYAQSLVQRMPHSAAAPFNLSVRELEILQRFIAGRSPQEIADEMSITIGTLYGHRHKIYQKMGVHSRTEAVRVARAVGLGE
jgi:LuxR family maltose regulon positive regulatory protein